MKSLYLICEVGYYTEMISLVRCLAAAVSCNTFNISQRLSAVFKSTALSSSVIRIETISIKDTSQNLPGYYVPFHEKSTTFSQLSLLAIGDGSP